MSFEEITNSGQLVVNSQIDGTFDGFNDNRLFPLKNGQYWIQDRYQYWYHYSYCPNIKIYKLNNRYYLIKEGQNKVAEVKRLDVIEGTIINDFRGWSGDTIFELDNGQIWKQSEYAYHYQYAYRPKAIIYNTGYEHKILVEGESVKVKKLR